MKLSPGIKHLCLLMLTLLALKFPVYSQSVSSSVISTAGGFYSGSSGNLSFTVAEMTMVQPFISSTCLLLQGFQQPQDNSVSVEELLRETISFFPNPVSDRLNIHYSGKENIILSVSIFDLAGQMIKRVELNFAQDETQSISFSGLSAGLYTGEVLFIAGDHTQIHTIKIQVIN